MKIKVNHRGSVEKLEMVKMDTGMLVNVGGRILPF